MSVVVPVYNNLHLTKMIVKNLEQTQRDIEHELIIVNDWSSDWTKEWLDDNKKENRIVIHQKNMGTNGARNVWVQNATGDYIAIINNDITLSKWWLRKMMEGFTDDDIWMTQPLTTNPKIKRNNERPFYFANHIEWWCYMVTKKIAEFLFPIDERLKIWWGDNRIFFKMFYAGGSLKIMKDVVVHHLEWQTADKKKNNERWLFMSIAKEEWWYVPPFIVSDQPLKEDLIFWP